MSQGDWEKLSKEQQESVQRWRDRISAMLITETENFHQECPELRLTWNFISDPLIRDDHPIILQEL